MEITHQGRNRVGIETRVNETLQAFPAVYISGPRQAGKTTLVRELLPLNRDSEFITFDDVLERSAAMQNPGEYLRQAGRPLTLDEVQMVPELFSALKMQVDELRRESLRDENARSSGSYLLTGSANLSAIPKLSNAMVGRMATISLYPLSAKEYYQGQGGFLEGILTGDLSGLGPHTEPYLQAMTKAAYPELAGLAWKHHGDWFKNYIYKITMEDPQHIYKLEKSSHMPLLLQVLANRAGSLINDADISRDVGITAVTCRTYRKLLEGTFITCSLEPWYRNTTKRLVKSGKQYFYDSMLLCHLLRMSPAEMAKHNPAKFGHILENFIFTELLKLINDAGKEHDIRLSFYRTRDGKEVDFVLEEPDGKLVGIEVKNSEKIGKRDLAGLMELKAVAGDDFQRGIILCNTRRVIAMDKDIYLVPISALWR